MLFIGDIPMQEVQERVVHDIVTAVSQHKKSQSEFSSSKLSTPLDS